MRRFCLSVLVMLVCGTATAQPPVTGVQGATLKDLAGTSTLVTVVLKSDAEDPNLQVVELGPDYVAVRLENGSRTAYKFTAIKEVRVQGEKVEAKEFELDRSRSLTSDEQRIVGQAVERAAAIFQSSNVDQTLKMDAAALLHACGREGGLEYLRQLAAANDLVTALEATKRLYLCGDKEAGGAVIDLAMESGNRKVRVLAAQVIGLLRIPGHEADLLTMLRDRAAEFYVPAARSLARLGNLEGLPLLFQGIEDINEEKSSAALVALCTLESDEIVPKMKQMLNDVKGFARFRVAQVLYAHKDPMGTKLLETDSMNTPSLVVDTAILLARTGNRDGRSFLVSKLEERFTESPEIMTMRARMAGALVEAGDGNAISILQELLRFKDITVQKKVCEIVGAVGVRRLMPITQSSIDSTDNGVALAACAAAIACANPDFHDRLITLRR